MLGELHKAGWNPSRTIIYCAWDGEEPGLLGSVEWVETHQDDLQKHAVAYINSDSNGRGYWHASGSHDLEQFINDVARDVDRPGETHLGVAALAAAAHCSRGQCGGACRIAQTA